MRQGAIRPDDDRTLLSGLRGGDQRAWARFFDTYRGGVFRLCHGLLRNREEAQDASQEVFLRTVRGIDNFRGDSSIRTWVYRIAMNHCLTRIEDWRRSRPNGGDLEDEQSIREGTFDIAYGSPTPEEHAASSELRVAVTRGLDELVPIFRVALQLHSEGFTYSEIAQTTGVPVETVKTRIHRARLRMRQVLRGLVDDLS